MAQIKIKTNKKIVENGQLISVSHEGKKLILICIDNNYKSDKIYYKFENLEKIATSNRRKPFNMIIFYTREELEKLIHLNKVTYIENIDERAYFFLKYR